jgi:hypothetical protein
MAVSRVRKFNLVFNMVEMLVISKLKKVPAFSSSESVNNVHNFLNSKIHSVSDEGHFCYKV